MLPTTSGASQDSVIRSTYLTLSNAALSDAVQSGIAAMQNSFRALYHQPRYASLAYRQRQPLVSPLNTCQTRTTLSCMRLQPVTFSQNPNTSYRTFFDPNQQIPVYSLSAISPSLIYPQYKFQNSVPSFPLQARSLCDISERSEVWGTPVMNQIMEMSKRKRTHSGESSESNHSRPPDPAGKRESKKKHDGSNTVNKPQESKQQHHKSVPNMQANSEFQLSESIVIYPSGNANPTLSNIGSNSNVWTQSHRNCTPSPPGCSSMGHRSFSTSTTQSSSAGKDHPPPSDGWSRQSNHSSTGSRPSSRMGNQQDGAGFPLPPGKEHMSGSSGGSRNTRVHKFNRKWKDTKIGREDKKHRKKVQERGMDFVVMSYNLLAQNLVHMNNHLYRHCSRDILEWNYRKCRLLQEMAEIDADVLCLQEVEGTHYNDFYEPEMKKLGYVGLFKQRTGSKHDGCATFYKRSRFDLVDFKLLEYRQPGITLLDRDNVAIVVLLQPKERRHQSQRLCITNTHLLYNPKRGDIKLAQLSMLLAEVDKIAHVAHNEEKGGSTYHPVIMCGDFNSRPNCPLVEFVCTGELDYKGIRTDDVSGQERKRSSRVLECPLWPHNVGVTDKCQYRSVCQGRTQLGQTATGANLPPAHANEDSKSPGADQMEDDVNDNPFLKEHDCKKASPSDFSSILKHPFQLDSAYPHPEGCREVTTNHTRANSKVDYIFYTSDNDKHIGRLDVLSRLTLFTDREADDMGGLPNTRWSSDHFSLAVQFLLAPQKQCK